MAERGGQPQQDGTSAAYSSSSREAQHASAPGQQQATSNGAAGVPGEGERGASTARPTALKAPVRCALQPTGHSPPHAACGRQRGGAIPAESRL